MVSPQSRSLYPCKIKRLLQRTGQLWARCSMDLQQCPCTAQGNSTLFANISWTSCSPSRGGRIHKNSGVGTRIKERQNKVQISSEVAELEINSRNLQLNRCSSTILGLSFRGKRANNTTVTRSPHLYHPQHPRWPLWQTLCCLVLAPARANVSVEYNILEMKSLDGLATTSIVDPEIKERGEHLQGCWSKEAEEHGRAHVEARNTTLLPLMHP